MDTARSSEALGFLSATRGGELGKGPGAQSQRDLGANWREGSSSAFPKLGPRGGSAAFPAVTRAVARRVIGESGGGGTEGTRQGAAVPGAGAGSKAQRPPRQQVLELRRAGAAQTPPGRPSAHCAWSESGGGRGAEPQERLGRGCGRGLPPRPAELEVSLDKVGPGGWAPALHPRPAALVPAGVGAPRSRRSSVAPALSAHTFHRVPLTAPSLTFLASAHHFPGLLTSRISSPVSVLLSGFLTSWSFSPPLQPPHLLPSLPASTSFLTFSPARPPLFLHPQGEGSDTLSRAVPRARGAGLGGGGASRAVFCPARALRWSRVPQGQIRCL